MKYHTILLIKALILLAAASPLTADDGGRMLQAGEPFAPFTLEAHDGTTIRSDDLHGSAYLIYFYPKADTPGCTTEACALRDSWAGIQTLGLKVFGVSFDSPEDNRAFADKYELPFLLLSDSDKHLARAVGAKQLMPFPKRISYLVGEDGNVLKAYPKVNPKGHAREVIDDFEALTD
jgi:peroxiredoxin Q/BCP